MLAACFVWPWFSTPVNPCFRGCRNLRPEAVDLWFARGIRRGIPDMKCYGVMTVYPRVGRDKLDPRDAHVAGVYAFEMDDDEIKSVDVVVERITCTFKGAVRVVVPEHFTMRPRISDAFPKDCRLIKEPEGGLPADAFAARVE